MIFQAKINSNLKFPKIDLQNELVFVGDRIIVPGIAQRIEERMDIDGNTYAPLAPATIKRKGSDTPLVETGTLRSAVTTIKTEKRGKDTAVVTLKGDRKKIGQYLQFDGIKTKTGKRYFNFFGVSDQMEIKAVNYIEERIKELIKNA